MTESTHWRKYDFEQPEFGEVVLVWRSGVRAPEVARLFYGDGRPGGPLLAPEGEFWALPGCASEHVTPGDIWKPITAPEGHA